MEIKRYLGIDYGDRRIGLAVGDSEIPIATPRETLDSQQTDIIGDLEKIIHALGIHEIVLGWPEHPDRPHDGKHIQVQKFAENLIQHIPLPIHLQDEYGTSQQATQLTQHLKKKKKQAKGHLDRIAAALILQSFLDGVEPVRTLTPRSSL